MAKDKRITVVGINYKDKPDNALRFLGELGNPFAAIGVDPNGKAAIDWGVYGIPESYLVGADGTILYKRSAPSMPAASSGIYCRRSPLRPESSPRAERYYTLKSPLATALRLSPANHPFKHDLIAATTLCRIQAVVSAFDRIVN